jgi:hypothetical protein
MAKNGWFQSPLKGVDGLPHRKQVAKSVQQGRAVDNAGDAPAALNYASWLEKWFSLGMVMFVGLGVIYIALGLAMAHQRWWLLLGVLFLVVAATYAFGRARMRRSVPLNQELAP